MQNFCFSIFNSFVLQLFHLAKVFVLFVVFVVLLGKRNFRNAITMIITSSLTVPAPAIRPRNGKCASYEVHTDTHTQTQAHRNTQTELGVALNAMASPVLNLATFVQVGNA